MTAQQPAKLPYQLVLTFKRELGAAIKQVTTEHETLESAEAQMDRVKGNPLLWNCAIYTREGTFVKDSQNYLHVQL